MGSEELLDLARDPVMKMTPHEIVLFVRELRAANDKAFAALRHVEDWQWGKLEPDLREDQLLSAETVRPMITEAIEAIKALPHRSQR